MKTYISALMVTMGALLASYTPAQAQVASQVGVLRINYTYLENYPDYNSGTTNYLWSFNVKGTGQYQAGVDNIQPFNFNVQAMPPGKTIQDAYRFIRTNISSYCDRQGYPVRKPFQTIILNVNASSLGVRYPDYYIHCN